MTNRRTFGIFGERLAREYLEKQGYKIVATNYWTQRGEIDIVAFDPLQQLVFCEVKARQSFDAGEGEMAIHGRKQKRMRSAALHYLMTQLCPKEENYRFDSIAVYADMEKRIAHIRHCKNIFWNSA